MARTAPCPSCKRDMPITTFGRCGVCGAEIGAATPSRGGWGATIVTTIGLLIGGGVLTVGYIAGRNDRGGMVIMGAGVTIMIAALTLGGRLRS